MTAVVLSPIGFVSDHMEVAFDLDTEALETAAELGLVAVRADSVGVRAPFVRGLVDLVVERAATARALRRRRRARAPRLRRQPSVAFRDVCAPGCCQMRAGQPTGIPAACSTDPLS